MRNKAFPQPSKKPDSLPPSSFKIKRVRTFVCFPDSFLRNSFNTYSILKGCLNLFTHRSVVQAVFSWDLTSICGDDRPVTFIKKFSRRVEKLFLLLPFFSGLISATVFAGALPKAVKNMSDEEYENYIHGIYMKNYRDPVPYETWSRLIQALPGKSHKLKFRDNLWDLSDSYFKDNLMWPKLWVVNAHIDNPHRIKQGDSVNFDRDTLAAVNRWGRSVDLKAQFPDIKIPPHAYQNNALEEWEIPSSLPRIKDKIDSPPPDAGFDLNFTEMDKTALLPFYLSEADLSGQGVVESKDGYGRAGLNGEDIMISYDGEIIEGGLYTIFENRGAPVFSAASLLGLNFKGYEIAVKAVVKIVGFVEGSEGLYRARIVESLAPVTPGHRVMKGVSDYILSQKGSPGSVSGKIIGSPHQEIKTYLGTYSLVYLDKGLSNGIQTGDIYDVRLNKKARAFQYPYLYERPAVGKLRVIHANPDTATAIIVSVRDTVKVGDFFEPGSGVTVMKDSVEHEEIPGEEKEPDPHEEMGMEPVEDPEEDLPPEAEGGGEETELVPSDETEGGGEEAEPVLSDEAEGGDEETELVPSDETEGGDEETELVPSDKTEGGDEGAPSEFDEAELNQPDSEPERPKPAKEPKSDSASPVPEEVKKEFMEMDQL